MFIIVELLIILLIAIIFGFIVSWIGPWPIILSIFVLGYLLLQGIDYINKD